VSNKYPTGVPRASNNRCPTGVRSNHNDGIDNRNRVGQGPQQSVMGCVDRLTTTTRLCSDILKALELRAL
jgi:hypothetical protein